MSFEHFQLINTYAPLALMFLCLYVLFK